ADDDADGLLILLGPLRELRRALEERIDRVGGGGDRPLRDGLRPDLGELLRRGRLEATLLPLGLAPALGELALLLARAALRLVLFAEGGDALRDGLGGGSIGRLLLVLPLLRVRLARRLRRLLRSRSALALRVRGFGALGGLRLRLFARFVGHGGLLA